MKFRIFNSLQRKIAIVFTTLIVVLLLIYSFITYLFDSKEIYNRVSQANLLTVEQLSNSFDGQIEMMEKASLNIASEPLVINMLKRSSLNNKLVENEIFRLFSYTRISWTEIDNLFIYDLKGDSISQKTSEVMIPPPKLKDYNKTNTKLDYGILLNNDHKLKDAVVSYFREVEDPLTYKPLGWVRLDLNMYNMNFIQNINKEDQMFMVLEQNGRVVYTNKPDDLNVVVISKMLKTTSEKGNFLFKSNNTNELISYYKSKKTNWIVLSILPEKDLNKGLLKARTFSITLVSISILISLLAAVLLSRKITLPLKKLHQSMKKVETGDMTTRVPVISNDEIGQLATQMNAMVGSIDHLINQVYQVEIKNREAQLKALSAQINPHFLYNTLETVDILSLKGKKEEVQKVVLSLSRMMRYAFKKDMIVSLEEELGHLDAYLQIQRLKSSEKMNVNICIPKSLYHVKIPKLTLQPIVENIYKHGWFHKTGNNYLSILAEHQENNIKISFIDNGKGVSINRLNELNGWLDHTQHENGVQHIGLLNVKERIRLNFGNEYGLRVYSKEGYWFKVVILLPFIQNEHLS